MKKIISILLSSAIILSSATALAKEETKFSDISGHWAEEIILDWQDRGIISGYPDGTFKPDDAVNRAELAKILTLAFDLKEEGELTYSDTQETDWYYEHLKASAKYIPVYSLPVVTMSNLPYNQNQTQGKNGYLPYNYALRMHVMEALVKIKMEQENIEMELPDILDIKEELYSIAEEPDYFELFIMHGTVPKNVRRMYEYTWLAYKLGIAEGNENGYFEPYGFITRAEFLTMIDRILNQQ